MSIRLRALLVLLIIIPIGLFSRIPAGRLPVFGKEFGDVLWATMFYLWIILLLPRITPIAVIAMTILITFGIEFRKLYHAAWIESVRSNRFGGILLGHAFYPHDFISYVVGAALALAIDLLLLKRTPAPTVDQPQ